MKKYRFSPKSLFFESQAHKPPQNLSSNLNSFVDKIIRLGSSERKCLGWGAEISANMGAEISAIVEILGQNQCFFSLRHIGQPRQRVPEREWV